jgi:adenylate cyclase
VSLPLSALQRCFQGILPSMITTCSADGVPNVSPLSHVHLVDDRHVALTCQFFNKTKRNLAENPQAELEVLDPVDLASYRLEARFVRAETSGPLFETMAAQLDAIASLSGMQGVFRLRSADVFEVGAVARAPDLIDLPPQSPAPFEGPYQQIRALQVLTQRINRARDLEDLFEGLFGTLGAAFGFHHGMVLVPDGDRLVTVASFGYGESGAGAEVVLGEGLIGAAAQQRRLVRVGNVQSERRYHQAMRTESASPRPEIPLPGLPDAHSQAALPLLVGDELVGMLFLESPELLAFDSWAEPMLHIVASQVALGMDRFAHDEGVEPATSAAVPPRRAGPRRTFTMFRSDDCVFVDGAYLIRNVPGLILWKLLRAFHDSRQTTFSNRELRLDPGLKLPELRDNLESRLILLRKRLQAQCPEVRLVPVQRGRFALEVDAEVELVEKP